MRASESRAPFVLLRSLAAGSASATAIIFALCASAGIAGRLMNRGGKTLSTVTSRWAGRFYVTSKQ